MPHFTRYNLAFLVCHNTVQNFPCIYTSRRYKFFLFCTAEASLTSKNHREKFLNLKSTNGNTIQLRQILMSQTICDCSKAWAKNKSKSNQKMIKSNLFQYHPLWFSNLNSLLNSAMNELSMDSTDDHDKDVDMDAGVKALYAWMEGEGLDTDVGVDHVDTVTDANMDTNERQEDVDTQSTTIKVTEIDALPINNVKDSKSRGKKKKLKTQVKSRSRKSVTRARANENETKEVKRKVRRKNKRKSGISDRDEGKKSKSRPNPRKSNHNVDNCTNDDTEDGNISMHDEGHVIYKLKHNRNSNRDHIKPREEDDEYIDAIEKEHDNKDGNEDDDNEIDDTQQNGDDEDNVDDVENVENDDAIEDNVDEDDEDVGMAGNENDEDADVGIMTRSRLKSLAKQGKARLKTTPVSFNCKFCSYQSKWKSNVDRHELTCKARTTKMEQETVQMLLKKCKRYKHKIEAQNQHIVELKEDIALLRGIVKRT
jgi:hypothetical protein